LISEITPAAIKATAGSKIFPAVAIARAVIESGDSKGNYGTSPLTKYNNYFGMTANKNYTGKKVLVKTWEGIKIPIYGEEKFLGMDGKRYMYMRYFRAYDKPEDSFNDFVRLVSNGRYKEAVKATTPAQQAAIISRAGYATAANAEELFIKVTNKVSGALDKLIDVVRKNKTLSVEILLGILGIGISIYYGKKRI